MYALKKSGVILAEDKNELFRQLKEWLNLKNCDEEQG